MSILLVLVACTRLYKPLCRSVGRLVGRSVGRSLFRKHATYGDWPCLWAFHLCFVIISSPLNLRSTKKNEISNPDNLIMQLMAFHRPHRLGRYSMPKDCNAHKHAPGQKAFQCIFDQFWDSRGIKGRLKTDIILRVGDFIILDWG